MILLPPARQLPVYSPLPASAVVAAVAPGDPRPGLAYDLRDAYDADEALLTASGTVALTMAILAAAARRPGAPIAIPGYACYDIVTAAVGAGAPVVVYDVDPATLTPDETSLARALAHGAAALVVVHLFGLPVPMGAMREAADRAGALLIEDAAQATGGRWAERPLGAHGDLGVLSFGRGKGETGGGGGALLLRRGTPLPDVVRARVSSSEGGGLGFVARLAAQWALGRPSLYAVPASIPMLRLGETIYRDPPALRGMSASSARVLMRTRPLAAAEATTRRSHAAELVEVLGERARDVAVLPIDGGIPGWLRFPLRLAVPDALAERGRLLGWATAYPRPLLALPALAPLVVHRHETPGADLLARTLSTVPTHSLLTAGTRAQLAAWLRDALTTPT